LVEKVEGAQMICSSCNTDLVCRLKDYGGDYKAKLQWQNENGSAHYMTKDGKNFTCNIPDEKSVAAQTEDAHTLTQSNLELLDVSTKNLVSNEADLILHIRKVVLETAQKYEKEPNLGMIWEMTALIWSKHFGVRE